MALASTKACNACDEEVFTIANFSGVSVQQKQSASVSFSLFHPFSHPLSFSLVLSQGRISITGHSNIVRSSGETRTLPFADLSLS